MEQRDRSIIAQLMPERKRCTRDIASHNATQRLVEEA